MSFYKTLNFQFSDTCRKYNKFALRIDHLQFFMFSIEFNLIIDHYLTN